MALDGRDRGVWGLITPHCVGRALAAERNAVIGAITLVGAVGGVVRSLEQRSLSARESAGGMSSPRALPVARLMTRLTSRDYLDRQVGRFSMANIPRTRWAVREVPRSSFQVIFGSVRRVSR
jgi:hypothetical protein